MEQSTGKLYNWTIISDDIVIKRGDKSFFEHRGSAIPKSMKWYFEIENLKYGVRKDVVLRYQGRDFSGRFEVDTHNRSRLFWHSDLGELFNSHYHNDQFPLIRFSKIDNSTYEVEFINEGVLEDEKEDPYTSIVPAIEGKKKNVYTTKYERNPRLRKKAIEIHGIRCMICGFDFEQTYGKAGQNFIEVHHIKPLSEIGNEVEVNPETDLICVCANCHRIIHRRKDMVYTIDEVQRMINDNK